ncbi:MAG TPA: hypothetical protein VEF89_19780 [Solirubrobacteraceae bacterium]|nr:hypothetical protein [Solirubrobacteraceae bacterium]
MKALPQVTGPTENALRALLNRQLTSSRIPDYLAWVCLNFSAGSGSRATLEAMLDAETKCGPEAATAAVEQLVAFGLLVNDGHPTPDGQAELAAVRRRVQITTAKLVAGVSEQDIATTILVLDHVRERAEALLED